MNRVKELCDRKGILQKELAISIGVSRPTVSDWWNKKKDPRGERLTKLSDYFLAKAIVDHPGRLIDVLQHVIDDGVAFYTACLDDKSELYQYRRLVPDIH